LDCCPPCGSRNLNLSESFKEHGRTSAVGGRRLAACSACWLFPRSRLPWCSWSVAGLMIQSFEHPGNGFLPDSIPTISLTGARAADELQVLPSPVGGFFTAKCWTVSQAISRREISGEWRINLPFMGFHLSLDFPAPPNSPGGSGPVLVAGRSVSPGYFPGYANTAHQRT